MRFSLFKKPEKTPCIKDTQLQQGETLDSRQLVKRAQQLLEHAQRKLNDLKKEGGAFSPRKNPQRILNLQGAIKLVQEDIDRFYAVGEKTGGDARTQESFIQRVAALESLIGTKTSLPERQVTHSQGSKEKKPTPHVKQNPLDQSIRATLTPTQRAVLEKMELSDFRGINAEQRELFNSLNAIEKDIDTLIQKMQTKDINPADKTRLNFEVMNLEKRYKETLEQIALFLNKHQDPYAYEPWRRESGK